MNSGREDEIKENVYVPVQIEHTGRPGRPKKIIDRDWLKQALHPSNKLTIVKIAKICEVHPQTIYGAMREYEFDWGWTPVSNEELDTLIKGFRLKKPGSGFRYATAFLHRHGFRVQQTRILDTLRENDRLGQELRTHTAIDRQQYSVIRSNYMWHMDGHHKLINYGIVLHGIVDGHDRTVYLLVSSLPWAHHYLELGSCSASSN
jgi:hypothetical protein